jgi:hypothetical protein
MEMMSRNQLNMMGDKMKKLTTVVLTAFLLMTVGQTFAAESGRNLAPNPTFEVKPGRSFPDLWQPEAECSGGASGKVSLVEIDGKKALRVEVTAIGNPGALVLANGSLLESVRWTNYFRLLVRAKVKVEKGKCRVEISNRGGDGWGVRSARITPLEWTPLEAVVAIVPGYYLTPRTDFVFQRGFRCFVYPEENGAVVYFTEPEVLEIDETEYNAAVKRIEVPPVWPEATPDEVKRSMTQGGPNMLGDSSFVGFRVNEWWWLNGPVVESKVPLTVVTDNKVNKGNVRSDYYRFKTGQVYTVSAYMRSDTPAQATLSALHGRAHRAAWPAEYNTCRLNPGIRKQFDVTAQWRRFSYSFIPKPSLEQAYYNTFFAMVTAPGSVEVDALQLQEGPLTDYAPKSTEVFLDIPADPATDMLLFDTGKGFTATTRITSTENKSALVTFELLDYYGKVVEAKTEKVNITAMQPLDVIWNAKPVTTTGWYVARATLDDGIIKTCSRTLQVCYVSPAWRDSNTLFCMQYVTSGKQEWNTTARRLGAHWFRVGVGHWKYHNPKEGEYVWKIPQSGYTDEALREGMAAGLKPWGSVGAGGGLSVPEWTGFEITPFNARSTPKLLKYWEDFARVVITRYKDEIDYWECWNESCFHLSPTDYVNYLKVFCKLVKEIDPGGKVMFASQNHIPDGEPSLCYFKPVVLAGGAPYFDIISYHDYACNMSDEPDRWSNQDDKTRLRRYQSLLKENGSGPKPLWSSEFNILGDSWYMAEGREVGALLSAYFVGDSWSYREAVNWAAKKVVNGVANRVELFSLHAFFGAAVDRAVNTLCGVDSDMKTLKPQALAMASACVLMGGAKCTSEIPLHERLTCYVFDKPGGALATVYAKRGTTYQLVLKDVPRNLRVLNCFGASYPFVSKKRWPLYFDLGRDWILDMSDEVVFLQVPGGNAADLEKIMAQARVQRLTVKPVSAAPSAFGDLLYAPLMQ